MKNGRSGYVICNICSYEVETEQSKVQESFPASKLMTRFKIGRSNVKIYFITCPARYFKSCYLDRSPPDEIIHHFSKKDVGKATEHVCQACSHEYTR